MRFPTLLSAHDMDGMFRVLPRVSTQPPVVISGFSQYKIKVSDLPETEQAKIDALADRIIAGYRSSGSPVAGVLVVGHADQDLSRGAKFEQNISVQRAHTALDALKKTLYKRARSPLLLLQVKHVAMRAAGDGARHRLLNHPGNESDRAKNRRVEFFVAESYGPLPIAETSELPRQKHLGTGRPSSQSSFVSVSFLPLAPLGQVVPSTTVPLFVEGRPTRPNIKHDHGFLDDGNGNIDPKKRQPPTDQDRTKKEMWGLVLAASIKFHPELKDANDAYRHFLVDNNGLTRTFDYDGFLTGDENGKIVLESAIEDTRAGVLDVFDKKFPAPATAARRDQFQVTSSQVVVGTSSPLNLRYPYPRTEDWQKTIGGHVLWLSADVIVDSLPATNSRSVAITLTLHAEDQYNFVPGGGDSRGIADAENGRFEITGLGTEFLQTGTVTRKISFTVPNAKQKDNHALPADQKVTK